MLDVERTGRLALLIAGRCGRLALSLWSYRRRRDRDPDLTHVSESRRCHAATRSRSSANSLPRNGADHIFRNLASEVTVKRRHVII
jgi:hypothetical protein